MHEGARIEVLSFKELKALKVLRENLRQKVLFVPKEIIEFLSWRIYFNISRDFGNVSHFLFKIWIYENPSSRIYREPLTRNLAYVVLEQSLLWSSRTKYTLCSIHEDSIDMAKLRACLWCHVRNNDSPQWYDIVYFEHKLLWFCSGSFPQLANVRLPPNNSPSYH